MNPVEKRVKKIIAQQLEDDTQEINNRMLLSYFELDELGRESLVLALEEEFPILIGPEEYDKLVVVQDLIDLVTSRVGY